MERRKVKIVKALIILMSSILLAACSPSSLLPRHYLVVMTKTDRLLNPSDSGRPAPLVVYIFQLKETTEPFLNADFFSLYHKSKATLGSSYVNMSRIQLTPNTQGRLTVNLSPDTTAVGIMAIYENFEKVKWRQLIVLDSSFGREKMRFYFTRYGIKPYNAMESGTDVSLKKPALNAPNLNSNSEETDPNATYEILSK